MSKLDRVVANVLTSERSKAHLRATTPHELRPTDIVTIAVPTARGRREVRIQRGELVRRAQSAAIARQTMHLALNVHKTESGRDLRIDGQWREVYADPSTDMRIIAPAQRGKTTYQLVKTMAQLSLGMAVGWVMPKQDKVTELVHGKLDSTIRMTPEYAALKDGGGGHDNVRFKTFGDFGKLYIVTANSESELTSFSADAMHIDERDFCHRGNLSMYPSRMEASPFKLTDEISTPTTIGAEHRRGQMGVDNIHSEFLRGDQHRWHTPCHSCGEYQIMDFYDHFVETQVDDSGRIMDFRVRDEQWEPGSVRDIRAICAKCRRPMDRFADGRWIALNPGARIRSRWIEALASTIGSPVAVMLESFAAALGNPFKMQSFHNLVLGRPYSGGLLNFDRDLFLRCVVDGHYMSQSSDGPCTIGIDVNNPWLDLQISRWVDGEQVKVYAAKAPANIEHLLPLCRRFGVVGGVIDHQPEIKLSTSIQEKMLEAGIQLVRCKYATGDQNTPIIHSEKGEGPFDAPRLITVNRTWAIDSLYESMHHAAVKWFADWDTVLDGDLAREFRTPTRKLVLTESGNEKYTWEGKPDHQMHAAVYDWMAGEILDMRKPLDLSDVMTVRQDVDHSYANPNPAAAAAPQQVLILLG